MTTQTLELVLTSTVATSRNGASQALSSMSTMTMCTMPMYGLSLGFVPHMATQAQTHQGLGAIPTMLQKPLYTNALQQLHLTLMNHWLHFDSSSKKAIELVNMLTHQMATILTPLVESNNSRYD